MERMSKEDMYTHFWIVFDGITAMKQISIRKLSEETGINYQTIAGWKQNKRLPDLYSAILIADYLSCPLEVMCRSTESSIEPASGIVSLIGRMACR